MKPSRTLPPLDSLRVFCEVARQGGFRKAGEELLISQSAVSHHIRKLEEALGTQVFHRHAKSISLTDAGQTLLGATRAAFGQLGKATAQVRGQSDPGIVKVSLLPSFAANWLLPRIDRFGHLHREIELELDPTLILTDVAQGRVDLAIRYGPPPAAKRHRLLFAEDLCPGVSPGHPAQGRISSPEDVLAYPLLDSQGNRDWRLWLDAHRLDPSRADFVQLRDYNLVLEAMASGLGLGIVRKRLVHGRIARGDIVLCSGSTLTTEQAAHWIVEPETGRNPGADVFRDWLLAEAAGERN